MKPNSLKAAARKAAVDAALYMTADVRHSALKHGWDYATASNTDVLYDGNQYKVHVQAQFERQAMDLEYGTERTRPTAVFRKYGNNTAQAERVFLSSLEKTTGWKK